MPINKAFTCPNSACRKKITEPILLNDFSKIGEHYYACPYCFIKPNFRAHMKKDFISLFLMTSGVLILAGIGLLILYDMTVWGKSCTTILFVPRAGEAISLGINMRVIYYF